MVQNKVSLFTDHRLLPVRNHS